MNPAMNVRGQHEMHPDTETLSAFTEQALNAKERGEVLEHLAACGRCRQVVALAREPAGAEVGVGRHAVARPRAWWRSWSVALVPAAALAATAVIAFYIHERAVERNSDMAKLEQQQANEKTATPPQAPEQPPAQAAPPAPRSAPAKSPKAERTAGVPHMSGAVPDETAAAPPVDSIGGPIFSHDRPAEIRELQRHGMAFARAGAPADDKTSSEAATYGEERKKQADAAAEERHQFAAKAATPSSLQGPESEPAASPTAGSSEQVEVDAQQAELQPTPVVNSGELESLRLSGFSGLHMTRPIHLPSRLPALSIASSDQRLLAIDKKGTLFFSEDSGFTWKKVKRQWTGRAILVRRKITADATPAAATAPESTGSAPATDSMSQSETVFELVNDQSELWLSADGRIWTAK